MDKSKYIEKYMLLLNTKQFEKLDNDPTKTTDLEDPENVEEN